MITKSILDERAMIIALLLDMPLGEPKEVDLDKFSSKEKIMILVTCCACMIKTSICTLAVDSKDKALACLEGLFADMRNHVVEIMDSIT